MNQAINYGALLDQGASGSFQEDSHAKLIVDTEPTGIDWYTARFDLTPKRNQENSLATFSVVMQIQSVKNDDLVGIRTVSKSGVDYPSVTLAFGTEAQPKAYVNWAVTADPIGKGKGTQVKDVSYDPGIEDTTAGVVVVHWTVQQQFVGEGGIWFTTELQGGPNMQMDIMILAFSSFSKNFINENQGDEVVSLADSLDWIRL